MTISLILDEARHVVVNFWLHNLIWASNRIIPPENIKLFKNAFIIEGYWSRIKFYQSLLTAWLVEIQHRDPALCLSWIFFVSYDCSTFVLGLDWYGRWNGTILNFTASVEDSNSTSWLKSRVDFAYHSCSNTPTDRIPSKASSLFPLPSSCLRWTSTSALKCANNKRAIVSPQLTPVRCLVWFGDFDWGYVFPARLHHFFILSQVTSRRYGHLPQHWNVRTTKEPLLPRSWHLYGVLFGLRTLIEGIAGHVPTHPKASNDRVFPESIGYHCLFPRKIMKSLWLYRKMKYMQTCLWQEQTLF